MDKDNVFRLVGRVFNNVQPPPPPPKLEFSTPVRSLTPELYSRLSSSIKRSRVTPAIVPVSSYDTSSPPQSLPSGTSTCDSAE